MLPAEKHRNIVRGQEGDLVLLGLDSLSEPNAGSVNAKWMTTTWKLEHEEACRRIIHPPTCASHLAALSYLRKEKKGRRGPSMEMSSLKGERTTTVRLPPRSGVPKIGASLNPFPCAPPCRL
jgi:hypothetical protein